MEETGPEELGEMSLLMDDEEKEPAAEAGRVLGQAGLQQKEGQRSRSSHTLSFSAYPHPTTPKFALWLYSLEQRDGIPDHQQGSTKICICQNHLLFLNKLNLISTLEERTQI